MPNRGNRVLIPQARTALDNFKYEVAQDLGIPNYESVDKGNLTSRQNGSVGGAMVKKMIQLAEETLMTNPSAVTNKSTGTLTSVNTTGLS